MAADQEGREGGSEDLFEDLDKFFASIGEGDWPDPLAPEPAPQEQAPPPKDEQAPEQPRPPEAAEPNEPGAAEPEGTGTGTVPVRGPAPRGAGEMSGADWTRLRDVLGEDEDEEPDEFPFSEPLEETSATESLFGYADPAEEEGEEAFEAMSGLWEGGRTREPDQAERSDRPAPTDAPVPPQPSESPPGEEPLELTVEDLRKPPPQYADLPKPVSEAGPQGTEPSEPIPGEPGEGSEELIGPRVPRWPAEGPAEEAKQPPPETPARAPSEPPPSHEPSLAEVEAAADRVAGEFPGAPGGVEDDLLSDVDEPTGPRTVKVGEPESLMGPAWEDPTARTLGTEPSKGPRVSGRDLPVAVITGVVLAGLALLFLAIARPLFAILASAVVLVAQAELYHTMRRRGYQPATALGLVLGGLTLAAAYLRGEQGMLFVLALGLVLTFLWYMVAPPKARAGSLGNIGATMLGVAYVPFLAGYILVILSQANSGRSLMLSVIALTFLYDVAAFFIGSAYGNRPLAPTISPKKSWEGLAAATVVTFALSIAFVSQIGPMTGPRAAGLALIVCILAPLGDLAESALKRDLGVKDMGTIMPGHGGALDRIDSALFVAPAAFYFLRLIL